MKFEVYQDIKLEWRWRLVARNKKIIADSGEGYKTFAMCKKGIFRILHSVADSDIYNEVTKKFV